MKKLVVSCKTVDNVFKDFKNAANKVRCGTFQGEPLTYKPRSIYELAKLTGNDVSNLNKVIQFFEEIGVIRIKTTHLDGRVVKQPRVEYDEVTFRLVA